jgi:hypothetical protein
MPLPNQPASSHLWCSKFDLASSTEVRTKTGVVSAMLIDMCGARISISKGERKILTGINLRFPDNEHSPSLTLQQSAMLCGNLARQHSSSESNLSSIALNLLIALESQ